MKNKNNIVFKLTSVLLIPLLMPSCAPLESTYNIEWKLDNGTVLEVDKVKEGEMPEYNGETPTKDPTNDTIYVFEGWDPEVVLATQDTSYIAKFTEEVRKYEIKWENYDGTLLKTDYFEYGAVLYYDGPTPTRPDGTHQSYVFDKWNFNGDTVVTFTSSELKKKTITAEIKDKAIYAGNYEDVLLFTVEYDDGL